jgi:hypothetical protein
MRKISLFKKIILLGFALLLIFACENDSKDDFPVDPDKASEVSVDRFSDEAATLMKEVKILHFLLPMSP